MVEMVQRFLQREPPHAQQELDCRRRVAIVGGRNIGEEYFSAHRCELQDLDLLVAGPAVEQASRIFDDYWNSEAPFRYRRLPSIPMPSCACWYANRTMSVTWPSLPCARGRIAQAAAPESRAIALEPCVHRLGPPMKHRDDDRGAWLVSTLTSELQSTPGTRPCDLALLRARQRGPGWLFGHGPAGRAGRRGHQLTGANDVAAVHGGYHGLPRAVARSRRPPV